MPTKNDSFCTVMQVQCGQQFLEVAEAYRELITRNARDVDEAKYITYTSRKEINITTIDKVHMICNHVEGSRLNGDMSSIIFSFHIDVSPGYKIIKEPNPISYKRIPPRPSLENY